MISWKWKKNSITCLWLFARWGHRPSTAARQRARSRASLSIWLQLQPMSHQSASWCLLQLFLWCISLSHPLGIPGQGLGLYGCRCLSRDFHFLLLISCSTAICSVLRQRSLLLSVADKLVWRIFREQPFVNVWTFFIMALVVLQVSGL